NFAEIQQTLNDAGERAKGGTLDLVKRIAENMQRMNAAAGKVFKFAENFAQDQANEVLSSEYAKIETAILKDVTALFADTQRSAAEASDALTRAHGVLQVVVLAAAGASMVIVVFIGIMLVRNITARLGRLTAAMNRLAAQDLTVDISQVGGAD